MSNLLSPPGQFITSQVWICETCGNHDSKTCSCAGAKASSVEERARKTVATLARRERREKSQQNQYPDPDVDIIEELPPATPAPPREPKDACTASVARSVEKIEQAILAKPTDYGRLIVALAQSTPESRRDAFMSLNSGRHQNDFAAVLDAVADLYQLLARVGRQ
jgi:hypothetical protein